jgi:REP element-mobilizing transposase RayT
MMLNENGEIAYNEWVKLQKRYPHVSFDAFQIMPNHIHGIIDISANDDADVGATLAVAPNTDTVAPNTDTVAPNTDTVAPHCGINIANGVTANRATARVAPTVGNIVGAYKSLVTNRSLEINKSEKECMGKLWQRNYYEHIIRSEQSHQIIFDYIIYNPANWEDDKFYCELNGYY